jgi:REP element-mobilizing transposase RayT
MAEYARGSHTIRDIKYHIVWITKYRYEILTKQIAERLRELLIQGCESCGITIAERSAGKEHAHMLISSPTHIAPAKIVQYLKGRSSRLIQAEEEIPGPTSAGEGVFLCGGRDGNAGDDTGIYRTPIRAWGQEAYQNRRGCIQRRVSAVNFRLL